MHHRGVNGDDANTPPGVHVAAGSTLTYKASNTIFPFLNHPFFAVIVM